MSSDTQRWRVFVKNLETFLRIGIYVAEKEPQRVLVNAVIEADYPARPTSIQQCISYEHVYNLVRLEWPERGHTELLETYATELLSFIFSLDKGVVFARVSLSKPDIFPEAEAVGVEAEWTRADFERLRSKSS